MDGVVLAAGSGTRLRPVSLTRPKATVPVCGRSLIERVLDSLATAGCDRFVVVVATLDDGVADLCRRWANGRPLEFAIQAERRGMGHALLQAAPRLDRRFILSACDSLVPPADVAGLVACHTAHDAVATLSLLRVADPAARARAASVAFDEPWIREIIEKAPPEAQLSDLVSLPLYVFEPDLLTLLPAITPSPRGELELQSALRELLITTGRVAGRLCEERWQVTSTDDLLAINRQFLALGETQTDPRAKGEPSVHVGRGAHLGFDIWLGPDVVVEDGAAIGDAATLRNAVVLRDAVVPPGEFIENQVVAPSG